jgi:hypothetical protein
MDWLVGRWMKGWERQVVLRVIRARGLDIAMVDVVGRAGVWKNQGIQTDAIRGSTRQAKIIGAMGACATGCLALKAWKEAPEIAFRIHGQRDGIKEVSMRIIQFLIWLSNLVFALM